MKVLSNIVAIGDKKHFGILYMYEPLSYTCNDHMNVLQCLVPAILFKLLGSDPPNRNYRRIMLQPGLCSR